MSRLRLPVSGIAFALFVAACGDDVVTTDGQMAEEEARDLFVSMLALQAAGADSLGFEPRHAEAPCPMGGVLDVDGTSRGYWHGGGSVFLLDALVTPRECKLAIGDQTYSVNGDPYLRVDLSAFLRSPTWIVLEGEMRRNVRWQAGTVSGICMIDVVLDASLGISDPLAPTIEGGYGGSVCGHETDVEWDTEWTFYCGGDPGCENLPRHDGQVHSVDDET